MVLIPAEMREYNAHQLVRITSYLLRKYLHMQLTSTRKKANAITSNILNRIAVRGQRKVADALGINESQISRWKDSFIPKMAMLLAVLEWGVEDEELAKLAKKVAMVLTKKSLKTAATVLRPDVERLDQSTGVIMTNTAKYSTSAEVTLPDRSVMWQISMMVTPDYQICCLRLIQAQI